MQKRVEVGQGHHMAFVTTDVDTGAPCIIVRKTPEAMRPGDVTKIRPYPLHPDDVVIVCLDPTGARTLAMQAINVLTQFSGPHVF